MKPTYDELYAMVEGLFNQKAFDEIHDMIIAKGYATDAELDETNDVSVVGKFSLEAAEHYCKKINGSVCEFIDLAADDGANKYYEEAAENYRQLLEVGRE